MFKCYYNEWSAPPVNMALSSSQAPALIGESDLGGWKVIGSGGFGQIFKARHQKLCCDVAVKLLHHDDGWVVEKRKKKKVDFLQLKDEEITQTDTPTQEKFVFAAWGGHDASREQPPRHSGPWGLPGSITQRWTHDTTRSGHGVHGERLAGLLTGNLDGWSNHYWTDHDPLFRPLRINPDDFSTPVLFIYKCIIFF